MLMMGLLSEPIPLENGVKQGDIPAPTLFSIYFAVMLSYAFQDCDIGVYIRLRTSGKVFNLRRFNTFYSFPFTNCQITRFQFL